MPEQEPVLIGEVIPQVLNRLGVTDQRMADLQQERREQLRKADDACELAIALLQGRATVERLRELVLERDAIKQEIEAEFRAQIGELLAEQREAHAGA